MRTLVVVYVVSFLLWCLESITTPSGYDTHTGILPFVISPMILYGLWIAYREHMENNQ